MKRTFLTLTLSVVLNNSVYADSFFLTTKINHLVVHDSGDVLVFF